jgi:hypothetical protein
MTGHLAKRRQRINMPVFGISEKLTAVLLIGNEGYGSQKLQLYTMVFSIMSTTK